MRTLLAACTAVGLDGHDAELIRLGENAIYRLRREPIVVRIARSTDHLSDVKKELAVAKWLASVDLLAVRPVASVHEQPITITDRVVSFWEFIPEAKDGATVTDLARLLRDLHSLPQPSVPSLSQLDPFDRINGRIERASGIEDEDRQYLLDRRDHLRSRFAELSFELPASVIHGDASIGNVMKHVDGRVFLLDLDGFAIGPREWDLTLTATYYVNFQWHSRDEYARFASTYGFDVMQWPGFQVLSAIRELHMVSWLMQNVNENPRIAAEFRKRILTLRNNVLPRKWEPY
jgi:aminoglycoside phosphotransferase (APT) family kinase protein